MLWENMFTSRFTQIPFFWSFEMWFNRHSMKHSVHLVFLGFTNEPHPAELSYRFCRVLQKLSIGFFFAGSSCRCAIHKVDPVLPSWLFLVKDTMPEAPDLINLGFLSDLERELILEVLRRDEELRMVEDKRVRWEETRVYQNMLRFYGLEI